MRNYTHLLLGVLAYLFFQSCAEESAIDKIDKDIVHGGALRRLEVTNNLDQSNMASTYEILQEAQDEKGGTLLSEVRVKVAFRDLDDVGAGSVDASLFSTIPAASFSRDANTGTNDLPAHRFAVTLQELADHVGITSTQFSHYDEFVIDFEMELTNGAVYNLDNASGDITRTGTFAYFKSDFRYILSLNADRVVVTSLSGTSSNIKSGVGDTVSIKFNKSLLNVPTITMLSSGQNVDGVVGAVVKKADKKSKEFYFIYTAGTAERDTISFIVSDGEAVENVPMDLDTTENVFIVDNKIDFKTAVQGSVANDSIVSVTLNLDFEELLLEDEKIELSITSTQFEDITVSEKVGEETESVTFIFEPLNGEKQLPVQELSFSISVTKAKDLAKNEIDKTVSLTVF